MHDKFLEDSTVIRYAHSHKIGKQNNFKSLWEQENERA